MNLRITPKQYELIVYIHPDSGPTVPLAIDLLEIETSIMGLDTHSNRNEARVRRLAEYIRKAFPEVDPYSRLDFLMNIMSRLSHVQDFSGVVLRLPGKITQVMEEDSQGQMSSAVVTPTEFARLTQAELQLKGEVIKLQQENHKMDAEIPALKTQCQQQLATIAYNEKRLKLLKKQQEDADIELARQARENKTNKEKAAEVTKELGVLQVKIEQLQRDNKLAQRTQGEVAGLRQQNTDLTADKQRLEDNLKKTRDDLRDAYDTIGKLEDEQKKLQRELNRIHGDIAQLKTRKIEASAGAGIPFQPTPLTQVAPTPSPLAPPPLAPPPLAPPPLIPSSLVPSPLAPRPDPSTGPDDPDPMKEAWRNNLKNEYL